MLISEKAHLSHSVPPSEKKSAKLSRSFDKLLRSFPRSRLSTQVWNSETTFCDSSDLSSFNPHIDKFKESEAAKALVWDCGSTLYDSFELDSIKCLIDKSQESDEAKDQVWNCGSTLYDAFELSSMKSLIDKIQESGNFNPLAGDYRSRLYDSLELDSINLHLHSATASRAMSMPNLCHRRSILPSIVLPSKKPSKLSRSIHKLLPSVFRRKLSSSANTRGGDLCRHRFNSVNANTEPIASLREALEVYLEEYSPEISSLDRRAVSERFAGSSIGIASAALSVDGYFPPG